MPRKPAKPRVYLSFDDEADKRKHFSRLGQLEILSNAIGLVLIVIVLLVLSRCSGVINSPVH
jgi:hypothetical protein